MTSVSNVLALLLFLSLLASPTLAYSIVILNLRMPCVHLQLHHDCAGLASWVLLSPSELQTQLERHPASVFFSPIQQQMDHQRFLTRQSRPGLPQLHKILRPRSQLSCGFPLQLNFTFLWTQKPAEHPLARNNHFKRSQGRPMERTRHMLPFHHPDSQQILHWQRDPSLRSLFQFTDPKSQGAQT